MPDLLPTGHGFIIHEELDSTSLEAKRLVAAGQVTGPLWLLARRQTAGYGRRGRGWEQETGDFAGTLVLPLKQDILLRHPAIASFSTALAVAETLEALGACADDIDLKWPNDVLLKGGKVCGLLLEKAGEDQTAALLIGIGINLVTAPEIEAYPTASLRDALPEGATVPTPEDALILLDKALHDWITRALSEGFEPLRHAFAARVKGIGAQISVRLPSSTISGIFEGIADDGALILRRGEQLKHITAGDIFFG